VGWLRCSRRRCSISSDGLVDVLDSAEPSAGWDGLIAAHGPDARLYAAGGRSGPRFVVVTLAALVEEQDSCAGILQSGALAGALLMSRVRI
jgi:hypothetical protein